jgi:hypothetical protein
MQHISRTRPFTAIEKLRAIAHAQRAPRPGQPALVEPHAIGGLHRHAIARVELGSVTGPEFAGWVAALDPAGDVTVGDQIGNVVHLTVTGEMSEVPVAVIGWVSVDPTVPDLARGAVDIEEVRRLCSWTPVALDEHVAATVGGVR